MTTLTEGPRNAGFIYWESNPEHTRENGEVLLGQDLEAGTVVRLNSDGRLTAFTGENFTDGAEDEVAGILIYKTDATLAHKKATYLARGDAVVNLNELTYPAAFEALVVAQLAKLGITARS